MKFEYGQVLKAVIKPVDIKITSIDSQNQMYEVEVEGIRFKLAEYVIDFLIREAKPVTVTETIITPIKKAVKEVIKKNKVVIKKSVTKTTKKGK